MIPTVSSGVDSPDKVQNHISCFGHANLHTCDESKRSGSFPTAFPLGCSKEMCVVSQRSQNLNMFQNKYSDH